jgi:hypothetical protein
MYIVRQYQWAGQDRNPGGLNMSAPSSVLAAEESRTYTRYMRHDQLVRLWQLRCPFTTINDGQPASIRFICLERCLRERMLVPEVWLSVIGLMGSGQVSIVKRPVGIVGSVG